MVASNHDLSFFSLYLGFFLAVFISLLINRSLGLSLGLIFRVLISYYLLFVYPRLRFLSFLCVSRYLFICLLSWFMPRLLSGYLSRCLPRRIVVRNLSVITIKIRFSLWLIHLTTKYVSIKEFSSAC